MTLRFVALAAAISITALLVAETRAAGSESDIKVISEYVVSHKHWSPKIFRIEKKNCDCAFAYYEIIYLPELKNGVIGGGKSFAVYYDEQLHKVVKELGFQ